MILKKSKQREENLITSQDGRGESFNKYAANISEPVKLDTLTYEWENETALI